MPCDKTWIDVLSALLTPTIALFAASIAYGQWKIAKAKHAHDLFDRRYAMYEAFRQFLSLVLAKNKVTIEEEHKFLDETAGARFIFDDSIADFRENIFKKTSNLDVVESELKDLLPSDERTSLVERRRQLRSWYSEELSNMEGKFTRFLKL